jgi:sigma-B regulation protein RsbU (phosphoserine phosphatase)
MIKNRSLGFKLVLFFSLSSILIFAIVLSYSYRYSREIIQKDKEQEIRDLALMKVTRIDTLLNAVQKVAQGLADHLENSTCSKEELLPLLRTTLEHNPEIYGTSIAFEPYAYDKKTPSLAPYFHRKGREILFTDLARESYSYFQWDWYQIPKELLAPQWSEPYFDEGGGNILMTTYSVPFYGKVDGQRRFRGIITADISLEALQKIVSSIKILKTGYGFLISKNGTLVTHPSKELIMNETLFGVAEARGDARLREIARKMIKGESGSLLFRDLFSARECWMTYTPIPSSGWSLAVLFPMNELMADVNRLYWTMIAIAVIGLALLSMAVIFISGTITRPLRAMAEATGDIARGNLDGALPPVKSRDEVGKMTEGFMAMQKSLKEYIRKLTETTAVKERMESELNIAREIQMSILPKIFPPFPDRPEFDLYAVIEPAREVGGDFYDFFQIDPIHLCLVMADVSGKGVPASLFMAVTKTLIKATAKAGITPAEILTRVNQELAPGNEAAMFVTLFCGILNAETGEICYANAGHNPPLLIDREGKATYLPKTGGLVLGVMEGIRYQDECLRLDAGESLFMYTDGVTEAMNLEQELFSEERLQKELILSARRPVQEIVSNLMQRIKDFSGEALQSDDITMMVLQYRGKGGPEG